MRLIFFLLFAPIFLHANVRTFTNNKGVKIQAEIVEINGDKVVLKMRGQNFPVPINSLSDEDQKFINNWKKASTSNGDIKANWDGEWPRLISVSPSQKIDVIEESDEGYVYESAHYRFHSNVKLKTSLIQRFALLFEATNQYMRELPLGMVKPFQEKKFPIYLYETKAQYHEAGGPVGSAGVYISGPRKDDILIPLTSLGVIKRKSGFSIDYDKENKTVSHEICHQLTDRAYYATGARGWFSEGLAEYIALSGYRSGKYNVDDKQKLIKYVTAYGENNTGGKALGDEIQMPSFKEWANQPYSSFTANSRENYGIAALVVYYCFHMDGEKDAANVKAFLKALKNGKKGEEALEVLLNGRSYEEFEKQITKAWRSNIKINWG